MGSFRTSVVVFVREKSLSCSFKEYGNFVGAKKWSKTKKMARRIMHI